MKIDLLLRPVHILAVVKLHTYLFTNRMAPLVVTRSSVSTSPAGMGKHMEIVSDTYAIPKWRSISSLFKVALK